MNRNMNKDLIALTNRDIKTVTTCSRIMNPNTGITHTIIYNLRLPFTAKLKDCLDCGLCCGLRTFEIEDNEVIPSEWTCINSLNGKRDMKRQPNGRCILQDPLTNKCTIYNDPRKPKICSEWQRGEHLMCYYL